MRHWAATTCLVLVVTGTFGTNPAYAQQTSGQRKIISRVMPVYPDLARQMSLEGAVKLEVVVAPNGMVKSVRPVGGSPVLLRAAQDAIEKWKWAPATHETEELIELKFHPD